MTSQGIDATEQRQLPSKHRTAALSADIGLHSESSAGKDHDAAGVRRQPVKASAWPRSAPATLPASARAKKYTDLSPMERAILPSHLRGRRTISRWEAAKLHQDATRWAEAGLDDQTVRPWHDEDITPHQAGYLIQRGVSATALDLPIPIGVGARDRITVGEALATAMWPVERIYELLVAAGIHTQPPQPPLVPLPESPALPTKVSTVPPVVFSHPGVAGH